MNDGREDGSDQINNKANKCGLFAGYFLCFAFLVIFIVSATFQDNDGSERYLWTIFYIMHATIAALVLLFKSCFSAWKTKAELPLLLLSLAMIIWSIVMITKSAIEIPQASGDGEDSENFSDEEEKIFELSGSILGLISTIYHALFWQCCGKVNVETPNVETAEPQDEDSDEEMYKA
mmetsp:Transcript_8428/g.12212  ORF Transcript_8428/g.12212 Transcript_8428/m.12212 type:complete len:177 (-) Transcript_8428:45-575(-)